MSYMNDDCDPFGIPYFSEHKSEKKVTKKDINSDKYWYDGCIIIGKGEELEVWESCNLLNQLSDENEQLKSKVEYLERKIQKERTSAMKQHEKWKNEIQKENEQLKQQIKDLYKFVKCDVDNEIDVYPKSILEHLVDILKIIGDVE